MIGGTKTKEFKMTHSFGKITSLLLILLELISGIILIMLNVILRTFSTDG
jgi:hypothetical protein